MRTDCEGRRGGLEKTNWEIRLCLDLNQRVSVIRLIRPPDSYRWDSKEQLSCLLFFISNMELKVPGWECALQPVMLWLMLFQHLLQHESREKITRMSGSLHSVLCFRCAENRADPPRKVFSFFILFFLSVVDAAVWVKSVSFFSILRVHYYRCCLLKCIISLAKKIYSNCWGLPTKKEKTGKKARDENLVQVHSGTARIHKISPPVTTSLK